MTVRRVRTSLRVGLLTTAAMLLQRLCGARSGSTSGWTCSTSCCPAAAPGRGGGGAGSTATSAFVVPLERRRRADTASTRREGDRGRAACGSDRSDSRSSLPSSRPTTFTSGSSSSSSSASSTATEVAFGATTTKATPPAPTTPTTKHPAILHTCRFLGELHRIRMPGDSNDNDDASFVGRMSVPSYAAQEPSRSPNTTRAAAAAASGLGAPSSVVRRLEGVIQPGPAFVLDDFLTPTECELLLETCETHLGFGKYHAGKNHHGALQIVVAQSTCNVLQSRLARHLDVPQVDRLRREMMATGQGDVHESDDDIDDDVHLEFRGLNRRWRVYRYAPGGQERFAPHIDAGFPPSGLSDDGMEVVWDASECYQNSDNTTATEVVSRLTLLMYLNDDFEGGHTQFYEPAALRRGAADPLASPPTTPTVVASIRPVAGSCLVFPQAVGEDAVDWARHHWPLHEGSPVTTGTRPKYVVRSDAVFATIKPVPVSASDHKLFQYDSLVRRAFLPTSPAFDASILRQVHALYQPHMGVENLGPLLHAFVRFTKVRRVVEVGAGCTTFWILQALADNDDELRRVQSLQRQGQCRLLDWPWTDHGIVDQLLEVPASLLCVDNCQHQKETATGAAAAARDWNLDQYLTFVKGDAFDALELESGSIDALWCDFGVGNRMRDFAATHWDSLRPGGFLLCHSTLTNARTREWLEAVRAHAGWDATGLPAREYAELSLLEPHKHYQNSLTLIQKRSNYSEPIHSEYA